MKVIVLPNNLFIGNDDNNYERLSKTERRWMAVLFLSGISGVLSGLIGITLGALNLLGLSDEIGRTGHLGSWLIFAFFPLTLLSAHALDKAGSARKAIKRVYCHRHGLKEDQK